MAGSGRCEVGHEMVGGGRLASNIDGRWEVDSKKLWVVGYWPRKQVRVGRLDSKTGGRLEVETPVGSYHWSATVSVPPAYKHDARQGA